MKRGKSYDWIPLWIDKWLFGTTRLELSPGERAVWIDLLSLAAKDDGYIRAGEGVPYPISQLAGLLVVDSELIRSTIEKCLDKKIGKLTKLEDGTLFVTNWEKYCLSSRWRRKLKSEKKLMDNINTDTDTNTDTNTDKSSAKAEHSSAKAEQCSRKEKKEWDFKPVIDKWNDFADSYGLPKIQGIAKGSVRERHLIARLREKNFSFDSLLRAIENSPFLLGQKKDFKATFDWIILPGNYQKIIEGNYFL